MKYHTTRASVLNGYGRVFSTGYCNLNNLLSFEDPIAYTSGVYGWNADIYHFEGFAIVTGYRPFGEHIPFEKIRKFEKKAEAIRNRKGWGFNAKKNALHKLAFRLCYECANGIE